MPKDIALLRRLVRSLFASTFAPVLPSSRVVTLEATLRKAWGRDPTRLELERIQRLRDAFGIGDNDAFLTIAAVLEFYDGLYRRYPDRCAEAAQRAIRQCLHSPAIGSKLTHSNADPELHRVMLACVATAFSVLLCAVSMVVGARGAPFWAVERSGSMVSTAAATILGAPAGWVVLIVLVVPAGYAGAWGWARARSAEGLARVAGVAAIAGVACGVAGWLALIACLVE